ncbi:MAG: leucine-rich repeat domain-containing protein [Clostridia bacterium]|nr:leucine-rich repeat domain-containing protein [Clostridia bacterium]
MKKIKSLIVALILFVTSAVTAFALAACNGNADETPSNNKPNDNLVFVEQSDGTYGVKTTNKNIEGALVIPATYNNADVSIVLGKAFYNCTKITSVVIPNTVKIIDTEAFFNCYGLNSVTIYPSIKEIRAEAFRSCGEFDFIKIGSINSFNYTTLNNSFSDSKPNTIYQTESN